MSMIADILSWACMLAGAFIVLVGGIGLVRLPDFYSRAHAAGMTDTLGAGLMIASMMLETGWDLNLARLLFIFLFLLFTSPTASHALTHSALVSGLEPWTRRDAKREDRARETAEAEQ
jgi:multicomponent Na+:H+ antiporter subunit G